MEQTSLKSLVVNGANAIIKSFSPVRINTNGYKYITCLNPKGEANNVYLGKGTAERMPIGMELRQLTKEQLDNMKLIKTINENGEVRFKFGMAGISDYTTAEALFEDLETSIGFDLHEFKAEFTAKPAEAVAPVASVKPAVKRLAGAANKA